MKRFLRTLGDAGAEVYEVGGRVRDRLLGRPLGDGDYLVRHLPAEHIAALLRPLGKVSLVGQTFGVIKFSPHEAPTTTVDIALPRREFSTGAGHRDFTVSFDPTLPVDVDLGRRDFTINALAQQVGSDTLIDPFGGKADLEKKLIRMVFPAAFTEDPLRMLRAIQFAARLQFSIEEETWRALCEQADLITTVSAERIIEELRKIMIAPVPSLGFRLMAKASLLKRLLPEVHALIGMEQDKQPGDDVFDHTLRVLDAARADEALLEPANLDLMFAALLHDVGKARTAKFDPDAGRIVFFGHQMVSARQSRKWLARMKATTIGIDPDAVVRLVEHHMFETKASFTDRAIRRFIAKIGKDLILRLMDLRLADNRGGKHPSGIKGVLRLRKRIREELDRKPPFGPKDLKINGFDLIKLGIPEGPLLGQTIKALMEIVLDHPERNERHELLALASQMKEDVVPHVQTPQKNPQPTHDKKKPLVA